MDLRGRGGLMSRNDAAGSANGQIPSVALKLAYLPYEDEKYACALCG